MKIKLFVLGLSLGISILSGCNDDLTQVGTGIQPENDRPLVYADTFYMKAKTLLTDSVYARTIYGSLGEIYDPLYGNLKSDFMCQFYCPENYRFSKTPLNEKIDSVEFKIYYSRSWTGDSLTPMRAQLYEVTTPLTRDFYTNIDPTQYCNMQKSLGMQTYTARDLSVSDSLWNDKNTNGALTYQPRITIRMPQEVGQRFYDATVKTPEVFTDQNTFNEFFPGVYVTNTYGTGNILNIESTQMTIYYKYMTKGYTGQDSIGKWNETFSATSEVIQLNRFKNTDMSHLLEPNDSIAYLKSPPGVYTELTIPAQDIAPIIKGRIVSNVPLSLKALPQEEWKYAFTAPNYVLILPKDSVDTFFKSNSVENSVTSYLGTYSASTRTYSFGNIAKLLKTHIENSPDEDLVISVVPVERRVGETYNYSYQKIEYTVAIENYLKPSGVKLRIDKDAMEMRIVTIEYR